MLDVTFAGWAATIGLIGGLFALDLWVSRPGHAHTVGFREAAVASAFFVGVALAFGVLFGVIAGWDFGAEYFAGYIVEKSLSVDNLFVFVVILSTFAVPAEHQHRVLTFGILIALVMRGIFIALGAALIATFSFMFVIFGLLLVYTAIQLFRHRDQDPDVERQPARATHAAADARDVRVPRRPHAHPSRRPSRGDAAVHRAHRHRQLGSPVRHGLDPGRLRRHPGSRSSSSPPTRSRCWACARCTSWSWACSTGSSTSPRACR